MIKLTDPFLIPAKDGDLDVVHAVDEVVHLTLGQPTDPVNPCQESKDPPQGWLLRTCAETSSVFIIRPTAQRYGALVTISSIPVQSEGNLTQCVPINESDRSAALSTSRLFPTWGFQQNGASADSTEWCHVPARVAHVLMWHTPSRGLWRSRFVQP